MFDADSKREMYRFCDCINMNRLYRGLQKNKLNYYDQRPLDVARQVPLPEGD